MTMSTIATEVEVKTAAEANTTTTTTKSTLAVDIGTHVLLEYYLKQLRLPAFLQNHSKVAKNCHEQNIAYSGYLERLAEIEVTERNNRAIDKRIRGAHFPYLKTLDAFDFNRIPNLNKKLVCELAKCEYIKKHENIITVGNSGMGKTHLAIALGIIACQQGFKVGYYPTANLAHSLIESYDEKHFLKIKNKLFSYDLVIIDELGYVPLSKTGGELLFDIFSQMYEQRSMIITTNLPFTEWTSVFGCEHLTGALLDRLTHHVHILQMSGESFRLQQSAKSMKQDVKQNKVEENKNESEREN